MKLFLVVLLVFFLFSSTEQYILLDSIRQNEQTTEAITFIPSVSLITKPNSYLYDPNDHDDDDDELDRVKRDAAPFVCKGNNLLLYDNIRYILLV